MKRSAIASEIAPCFVEDSGAKTDVVVLGCTHYPLLLDRLDALAPWPVTWLDPAPAIARRIANVLAERGHVVGVGAKRGAGIIKFTSGRTAVRVTLGPSAIPQFEHRALCGGCRSVKSIP